MLHLLRFSMVDPGRGEKRSLDLARIYTDE